MIGKSAQAALADVREEIRGLLDALASRGWTLHTATVARARLWCSSPCGNHQMWIELAPLDPARYCAHVLDQLRARTCWED